MEEGSDKKSWGALRFNKSFKSNKKSIHPTIPAGFKGIAVNTGCKEQGQSSWGKVLVPVKSQESKSNIRKGLIQSNKKRNELNHLC